MSTSTLWLGRALDEDDGRSLAVRVWTERAAPSSEDWAEVIEDPFEGARVGGGDPAALAASGALLRGDRRVQVGALRLTAPVLPRKIVCVGRNFAAHAREMGSEVPTDPLIFFKPSSALIGPGQAIELPRGYARIDMEAELVVVVGKAGRRLTARNALDHVLGYTLGNDVSCRDLQRLEPQWARAKGFDTFAPLGPWIRVTSPGEGPPPDAEIHGLLDGESRQRAPLGSMVFGVPQIVAHVSQCMKLEPGDILYTGTPEGVTSLTEGRTCEVRLEGWSLGCLTNPVVWAD